MDQHGSRIALVTGAGSGIGEAAARALLGEGWSVVLVGRRRERLEALAADSGCADRCLVHVADVTDPDAVARLFSAVTARFGRLDLLFNNAGFGIRPMPLEDVPLDKWQSVLDTNLTGAFLCLQGAFRLMKAQNPKGGRIINNGSIAGQRPRFGTATYSASKFGLLGLTQSAALEGREHGIAVGQIDVGPTDTEPMRPVNETKMDVADVARAVLYMANLPLGSNALQMTLIPTSASFISRD
jgi:NAD(P)-dependent dehydrogenase (short-subunit alcohol dehydrogenase family)